MAERPSMHARDSSGRRVSLLNDEPATQRPALQTNTSTDSVSRLGGRTSSTWSLQSVSSLDTPILLRSESYDSNSTETRSPITPDHAFNVNQHLLPLHGINHYKEQMPLDAHLDGFSFELARPTISDQQTNSYDSRVGEDEEVTMDESGLEKAAKRYPCRYRDSYGCEKTFTTSGHASRHSKIHTAEKAVPCTHENCTKKFTRSDNMKQHLETHNKEKDRSRILGLKSSGSKSTLFVAAGVKKPVPTKKISISSSTTNNTDFPANNSVPDSAIYASQQSYSIGGHPSSYSAFEMDGVCNILMSRPVAGRAGNSSARLDVLAHAAASVPNVLSPMMDCNGA